MGWIGFGWLILLATAQAQAASFDCGKAKSPAEKFVCTDQFLSKLDTQMDEVFQGDITKSNAEQKARLMAEQRHWLKITRNVCVTQVCFKHAYWSRLAELETFFEPRSSMFEKESDKVDPIKHVLSTAPLYDLGHSDPPFCRQFFEDLKQMKDIHFVEPILQAQSYEDPALDAWRGKSKNGLPLNMDVTCEWQLLEQDSDGALGICPVKYGLPPFRVYELPPSGQSGEMRYFIYYDGTYGPMNIDRYKPGMGDVGHFKQFNVANVNGAFAYAPGGRPSFNSIIEYKLRYYFLQLTTGSEGSIWFEIDSVLPNRSKDKVVCSWSPVQPGQASSRPKPRKRAKPIPSATDE
jgi:uncharacterized protein